MRGKFEYQFHFILLTYYVFCYVIYSRRCPCSFAKKLTRPHHDDQKSEKLKKPDRSKVCRKNFEKTTLTV